MIFDAVYLNIPTLALNISKKKTFTNNLKTIELNITKEICSLNKLKKYFEEFNFDLESNFLLKKRKNLENKNIFFSAGNSTEIIIKKIINLNEKYFKASGGYKFICNVVKSQVQYIKDYSV